MQISEVSTSGALISQLEDALLKQQLSCLSASALEELKESHFQSHIQHRLEELEGYCISDEHLSLWFVFSFGWVC